MRSDLSVSGANAARAADTLFGAGQASVVFQLSCSLPGPLVTAWFVVLSVNVRVPAVGSVPTGSVAA